MTKTKYFLYAFKTKNGKKFNYWYETDLKYFQAKKPPQYILNKNKTIKDIDSFEKIENPWLNWDSNNIQLITTKQGICINYLKITNHDLIQKEENLKLLELYEDIVKNFDISKNFGFEIVKKWHKTIFKDIYPFAGKLRSVEMSKGSDIEAWTWKLSFIEYLPQLDNMIFKISKKRYEDIEEITSDLSKLISDFLFIHPFREGNGRLSRLLSDLILAKNGFPMIGLNLKKEDNYIEKIHQGYLANYEPLQQLLKEKLLYAMKR